MSDQKTIELIARLDDAALRWWVPSWLSDLLTRASAEIEAQMDYERILQMKLNVARGNVHD